MYKIVNLNCNILINSFCTEIYNKYEEIQIAESTHFHNVFIASKNVILFHQFIHP